MRAVICSQWGPPESLQLGELPEPRPAAGEVLLCVDASALNFADLLMISRRYQFRPQLPFAPGFEAAGEVLACGTGVEHLRPGDRAMALCRYHGGFAERVAVQAATCVRIPDDLDFVRAAALPIAYSTAIIALQRRGELASGERLLVLGAAGGVGLATVELGRQLGAEVIAAAGSAAKLSLAADRGASHGVNYRDENLRERVMELTDGAGVDVVFDSVGGAASEQVMRCLARGGRQLLVGFASGKIPELRANRLLLANNSALLRRCSCCNGASRPAAWC